MNDVTRMDQTMIRRRQRGFYTANLLGNIKSHLAGLQGYDVMALELIQNADDAGAAEIIFNITDRGLLVTNSGEFTYCGDLDTRPCAFSTSNNYSCDYHRIADVGSGGKLSHGENIGRFGIGFVSTYQVTDHPEIRSSGIKLTLYPEDGQWFIEPFDESGGTSFFLPWADDPRTEGRLKLGVSHVTAAHIDQLAEDFQKVLRESLLFLRHVRKAEVKRNGELLLACDLDRGDGSDLIVTFRPSGDVEQWHILHADASEAAAHLYKSHPRLEALRRSTKISIGLRIDPEPLDEGLLYAFLPTEQSTGLPLHINADFFPESDRKAVIFAGHQHEQAWNEMLIDAAAAEIARDPEGMLKKLGHIQLWDVLSRAYGLFSRPSGHPVCFKGFWERLKPPATQASIALAHDGSIQRPGGIFITQRSPLNAHQAKALLEIGGRLVSDDLRPYQTAINQLGAPILTFERLTTLLESALAQQVPGSMQVGEDTLDHFYRPLWSIVNDFLPDVGSPNPAVQRLLAVPFIVTEDRFVVTIKQSHAVPASLDASRIATLLPRLAIASHDLLEFPKISRLIRNLELSSVVSHIDSMCASDPVEDVIGVERSHLRDLYALFADLDRHRNSDKTVYQTLRGLPIWLSSRGLVKATQALLPGDFTDPTGQAELLDASALTESAREFASVKLGVQTQTIEAFVQTVLPTFFNDNGPLDETKYARLITELANHPSLVNDEDIRHLLASLPLVPTQDGKWCCPTTTYRRTDELVKVLGDARHLWLDVGRVPNTRSVEAFLDSLGILRSPIARHLVDRMLFIAEKYLPTDDAKRASSDAFYVICDNFEEWKEKNAFQDALDDLRTAECFPAEGDAESWHRADSTYAPYRPEAFHSQAKILDFRNTTRLKTELLRELGVSIEPETKLVVGHLKHCVAKGVQPHVFTYQVLNERAQRSDPLISTLAGSACVYIESQRKFVRPNQLYWSAQQLGRYAFTIPGNLESFKPLFTAIGVKNAPEGSDLIDILLDIVGEYFEHCKPVSGTDRAVYEICLAGILAADEQGEMSSLDLRRMQQAPTILNLLGQPTHPDEVLLQDSEWHAGFFNGELDRALCKPIPELWPLVEKIGVKRLSNDAQVTLEFFDGEKIDELPVAERLIERTDIIARLLHDKPSVVRSRIQNALVRITAVSYELVRIQASVRVGHDRVSAPPTVAQAFYDVNEHKVILARPVGSRSWSHVLNAIFHQLMPEEPGSEISKLTLSLRPLMGMSVEDSHRELTDAGIPYLDAGTENRHAEDLKSSELGNMGNTNSCGDEGEGESASVGSDATQGEHSTLERRDSGQSPAEPGVVPQDGTGSSRELNRARPSDGPEKAPEGESPGLRDGSESTSPAEGSGKEARPKHKRQWDRRLLSYVRKTTEGGAASETDTASSEHNLGIEAIARDAVCAYERDRGRVPEQMAQTHPGYDIISRNPLTGEERFIEVKGVSGEWNQTGVGLSRLQFSNAQDYGERYWLYVVEFVSDPQHKRVHPIRSPATQVTSFMFDGNWREAAAEERADPSLAFIVGARVKHQHFGYGRIQSMELKGSTRVMSIEFGKSGRRTVTLNLYTMSVVGDDDDDHP